MPPATAEHQVRLLDDDDGDDRNNNHVHGASDVDGILSAIGEFGWFQKRHYLLMNWTWIINALVTFNLVFVSPSSVPWRCAGNLADNLYCNTTRVLDSASSAQDKALLCDTGLLGSGEWQFADPRHSVTAEFMVRGCGERGRGAHPRGRICLSVSFADRLSPMWVCVCVGVCVCVCVPARVRR